MSMKVTMPRYELQPVTMARWRTAGRAAAYRVGPTRAGDREPLPATPAMAQMQSRQTPVAVPGVRHEPIRESAYRATTSFQGPVLQPDSLTIPVSVEQPCR